MKLLPSVPRLTALAGPLVLLALAPPAQALQTGAAGSQIPSCLLVCQPFEDEPHAFFCEEECIASGIVLGFASAVQEGESEMPRFANPSTCSPSIGSVCPPGDEVIRYNCGDLVTLSVGRWAVPAARWIPTAGTVQQVWIRVAPMTSVLTEQNVTKLPWQTLGRASFDSFTGTFDLAWDTSEFCNTMGYLFRAEVVDPAYRSGIGFAYNIAIDPGACGADPFGKFPAGSPAAGANTLDLSHGQGLCPGSVVELITTGVPGQVAFVQMAARGGQSTVFGGTLWLDPSALIFSRAVDAVGGVAKLQLAFAPTPSLVGTLAYFQTQAPDPMAPAGVALSNGLRITVCPCP